MMSLSLVPRKGWIPGNCCSINASLHPLPAIEGNHLWGGVSVGLSVSLWLANDSAGPCWRGGDGVKFSLRVQLVLSPALPRATLEAKKSA